MPKKFIQRILPDPKAIKDNRALKVFGKILHEPNLWHLNRRSACFAFSIGLFFAFWPVPFQMWLSAAVAIPMRANLPLSVATVWVTNPFTMPPIFYGAYLIGSTVLGTKSEPFHFEPTIEWICSSLTTIGPAFLTGCAICSVVCAILGYYILNWLWRLSVLKEWRKRCRLRHQKPQ